MSNDKKHVIPRAQYGRKRRAYFHNEEREQRIEKERNARKQRAEKEEILAKNNEARVKDNLRKARIEKLTQEEIHQQRALAAQRSDHYNAEDDKSTQNIDALEANDQTSNQDNVSEGEEQAKVAATPAQSKSTANKSKAKTESHKKMSEASGPISKQRDDDHFYSEEAQQSRVNHYIEGGQSDKLHKDKHTYKDTKTHTPNNGKNNVSIVDKIKYFLEEHWAKILIVIAVILLIVLINAIFNNVDRNGTSKDSIFQSSHNEDKTYTTTMKSANSAIHSVVTVENDTGKHASSAEKETQEAGKENELGSGVVYKKVGDSIFIITNAHVVGDKKEQKITYGNNDYTIGTVIGSDKYSDIAVVKAKVKSGNDVKPIKMGDSSTLVLGEPIIVVGNPLGVDFKGSVSEGIVSGLNRHVPVDIDKDKQYDVLMNAFQIDAPVNPGNSGGGVIDQHGKLIGIASIKIDMENVEGIAFAIPVNDATNIAKQLEANGEVTYPNTGVKMANIKDLDDTARQSIHLPSDVNHGVVIGEVKENSLGEKSGLQKNDVIVELDGKEVEDNLRYRQIIFSHKDDLDTLPAKIYRDGKVKDIKLKLK
ncbi:trypsin-like peptidase domain-containing protein [Staphylococcus caeli]|uniref:S1C family serine protease n=1 Tax=Staphylococcus caeli TaxID=2201815 RepID=UPI003F574C1A